MALRGLLAAPLVLGGGLAALLWLPKLVREQVTARVQERTGLPARVTDVSLGLTSVSIEELGIGQPEGDGDVRVRARDVVLDASPLMLALRGSSAVQGVRVASLEVSLPLHAKGTQGLLARVRARGSNMAAGEAPQAADARTLDLQIDAIAVSVRDEHGELVRLDARASANADGAQLDIGKLRIGQSPEHAVELEQIAVRAARAPQGLRLARVSVKQGRVSLATPAPEVAAAAPMEEAGDPDSDAPPPPAAAAPEPQTGTWGRLLRFRDALSPANEGNAGAATAVTGSPAAQAPPGKPVKGGAALSRLADDAELALESASVHVGDFAQKPILQKLRATLKMQPGRGLSLAGSGNAAGGGAVAWDLVLQPEPLQADGKIELRSLPLNLLAPLLPNVPWYQPEHGRVDAELVVKTESAQVIALSGEATLRDAAIAAARIAPGPVQNLGFSLRGEGKFMPLAHRLEIAKAELSVGQAAVSVSGALEWSRDHYLFDIDAVLPLTACTHAVRVIPEDLLGDMGLATWQGKLGGKLRLKLDSRDLDAAELDVDVNDRCEFATVPVMADLRRFQMPFVHSVLEPDGSTFEMETGPGTSAWAYLEDISPFFVHAVLAHEDGGFFSHRGFSLGHIRNALVRNLKAGRYVVGASTITMQLVKNVFLHREKTLARKIQEVLLTWWIERVMEKRDIVELYLNVIEYGPGVYGIRNGARHYFNRLPAQLSPAEAVYLSTILPNPKRYHSHFERGALSPQWTEITKRMLARLRERGSYSPEAAEYGLSELKAFRFVPEGTVVAPRQIEGSAAPLPYMRGFADDPGWDDELGALPFEYDDDPLPTRTEPNAERVRRAPTAR